MHNTEQYSIRQLSEISGVNAVTLRAWERRYGLLKPQRTPKGHRYYTSDDIENVRRIINWLDRGVAISKVRPLLEHDNSSAITADTHWQDAINASLTAIASFQREKLLQQISELFASYPLDTLATNFIQPILAELDRKSQRHFGGSAEKIFLESELHAELMSRIHHLNNNNRGAPILLVVLDGQQQNKQPPLLALALLEAGFRLRLLFEACSLREIPYIVEQSQYSAQHAIKAVICHSDSKQDIVQLPQELARAAQHARVPFFLSGGWLTISPALENIAGVIPLPSLLREAVVPVNNALRNMHWETRHDTP